MRFALDDNGKRIKPSHSGQKAKCPLCGGTLIGKCGEIYVWHWQHHQDRNCDPWKEHETEWHSSWKGMFPDEWQEIVIEMGDEKHIADVQTPNGVVIEFQNSPISTSTIKIREAFYKNMIWVVNANEFKENVTLYSEVTKWLKKIERDASRELRSLHQSYQDNINNIEEDINTNIFEINKNYNLINNKSTTIARLNLKLAYSRDFTNSVLDKWSNGEPYWEDETYEITSKIPFEMKSQLQKIPESILELWHEVKKNENFLQYISNLEDFPVEGKTLKIVQYEQITPSSFNIVWAISKKTRKTLFPEILDFKSEIEFVDFKYRKDHYDFAIDPTNAIDSLNKKIEICKDSIFDMENQLQIIKESISKKLITELEKKIHEIETELIKLKNFLDDLKTQKTKLIELKNIQSENYKAVIGKSEMEIDRKKQERRLKVMKEKKGLYTFEWRYERKSWKAANKNIYFDIGEIYLLEQIGEGLFRKIEKTQFLDNLLNVN